MDETENTLPEGGAPAPETEHLPANTAADSGTEQQTTDTQEAQPDAEADARQKEIDKRFARLTREKWDAKRDAAALKERLEALEQQIATPRDPNAPLSHADVDRMAEEKARGLVEQRNFNDRCNEVYETGIEEFPDFKASIDNFKALGGLPPALVEAALETDVAAKVLHHLGANLEEAESIVRLSPARMGAAVAKLAAKLAAPQAPAPVSKAPTPIKPIAGKSIVSNQEPTDPEQWKKWFLAERAEHKAKRRY